MDCSPAGDGNNKQLQQSPENSAATMARLHVCCLKPIPVEGIKP